MQGSRTACRIKPETIGPQTGGNEAQMIEKTPPRLSFWKKAIFGMGDIYAGGGQQLVGFLYFFFLTDVVGLRPALAGLAMLICKAWDAISDPMMGVISDRTKSRWGRRRPYFLAGTVLIFLSFSGLWLPFRFGSQLAIFAFTLLVWLFHETICSMVLVPFYALGGDLTADYNERNAIMFSRLFISSFSVILAAVLPKMIVSAFADQRAGYALMGAAFAVLFALPWLLIFYTFPERGKQTSIDETLTVREQITEPLRIRSCRQLMLLFICGYAAVDVMSGVFIYFMTYFMHRTNYNLVLGALLIGQICLLPVSLMLANKIGKRNTLILGYAWWILLIIGMATLTPAMPKWLIFIAAFLMGGGSGTAAFIPWAIFPDVADVGELVYGVRREGVFSGFLTFSRKCASALAMGTFGVAIDLAGFVKPLTKTVHGVAQSITQVQPEAVNWVIRGYLFLMPLCLLTLGIFIARRFNLTPQIHARIQAILLARRDAGRGPAPSQLEIDALSKLLIGGRQMAKAKE